MIECEHIVVRAFLTPHEVATFRASKLPEEFYAVKAEMEKRKTTMLSSTDPSRQATQDPLLRGNLFHNPSTICDQNEAHALINAHPRAPFSGLI